MRKDKEFDSMKKNLGSLICDMISKQEKTE